MILRTSYLNQLFGVLKFFPLGEDLGEASLAFTPYTYNRIILTISAILFAYIKKMLYICGHNSTPGMSALEL